MRILHVSNNLGAGGAEKLLTDILPRFAAEGHEVELAISNSGADVPKYHDILQKSNIFVTDLQTSYYNPVQIFRLARLVKRGKFDLVHAHLFPTQYWLAFASLFFPKTVKMVKTEHSVINQRMGYRWARPLERFVYSRYHAVIAITETVAENLSRWIGRKEAIVVINNGVNLAEIESEKRQARRSDYDFLEGRTFNILMVGRFDFTKDQASLLKAVARLPEHVHVFFAGKGPDEAMMQKLAVDLNLAGRAHFLGLRTDVYRLMSLVDLNVLSTNQEGLSGVALESLASGSLFLGTDTAGVCDVVPSERFLFPKQDPEKLAEKILEVMNDMQLRQTLADRAREHVKAYDMPVMVEKYLNVYKDLIEKDT